MITAILYHANCPDGFAAAWVAKNAGISAPVFVPVSHGIACPDLPEGVSEIYLLDFAYPVAVLNDLASKVKRLIVLDHHQTAIDHFAAVDRGDCGEALASNIDLVLDCERSGAGITWDYFHPGQPRPHLVNYVEDGDLWRFRHPDSKTVGAFVRTLPHEFAAWDDANLLSVADMCSAGLGAVAHIEAYVRASTQHAYWCEMGDRSFPIVNVTYESCSEVANALLDQHDTDMAGYYFRRGDGTWQYGFRSRNGVTVHDFATQFGGGGHPQASGCVTPEITHRRCST